MAYDYGDRREKSIGGCTNFFRFFLMFVNLVFILASIAGIVAGVLLMEGHGDQYLKFCTPCKQFNTFIIIVFAALLFFSFIGFVALCKRNSCMLVVYAFFQVIFFLGATCIVIVIFMIHDGRFDKRLEEAWQEEAKENTDDSLCKFQYDFKCSGWNTLCPHNLTLAHSNYTAEDQKNCPDCVGTEYMLRIANAEITDQSCHTVLKNDVNKYFWYMLGVGFGLMFLTMLSIVVSCKVRVVYEEEAEYQEINERF